MSLPNSTRPSNWRTAKDYTSAVPVHTQEPQDKTAEEQAAWMKVVAVKRKRCKTCEICGTAPRQHNPTIGPLHGHHRLLKSQGGPSIIENCLLLCQRCHDGVHAHPENSYVAGHMIRSGSPEAKTLLAIAEQRARGAA